MKKLFLFSFVLLVLISVLPLPVSAAGMVCSAFGTPQNLSDLVCLFIDLITTAMPVVAGIALAVFFWGLAKFILNAGDEGGREEGKEVMKWGIVALFVMISIWGIVIFLHNDFFGTTPSGLPFLPTS